MPDLDYAKVIGRFALQVGDASDPDDAPDTVWCDGGQVIIEPLVSITKVPGAAVPFTTGHQNITATIDSEGYLSYNGNRFVWVVDLTSSKVNPNFGAGVATHRIRFNNVTAGGVGVTIPMSSVRITGGADNDLTTLLPMNPGSAQLVTQGPQGTSVQAMNVINGELQVTLDDGTHLNAGAVPIAPGGTDAGVAEYINTPGSATASALSASTDARIADQMVNRQVPALTAGTADRPGVVEGGVYFASQQPWERISRAVARARGGVEYMKVLVGPGDSLWQTTGATIGANRYDLHHTNFLRRALAQRTGLPALTGIMFSEDWLAERPKVATIVGADSDWSFVGGGGASGPLGRSGLKPNNTTTRKRISLVEDYEFDQVNIYYLNAFGAGVSIYTGLDGAAETTQAVSADYNYRKLTITFPKGMRKVHTLVIGCPDAAKFVQFIGVEPVRSDNKFVSVTKAGVGGATTQKYLDVGGGYEQFSGNNRFYPSIMRPHVAITDLGHNDAGYDDYQAVTPDQYETNLNTIAGWTDTTYGVTVLVTQAPRQGGVTPSAETYAQRMYNVVDANPSKTMLVDMLNEWVSYEAMGGATTYYDTVHPGTSLQPVIAELTGRWAQRIAPASPVVTPPSAYPLGRDSFTRADGAIGSPQLAPGSPAWTTDSGTWNIVSNEAKPTAVSASRGAVAVYDHKTANVHLRVKIGGTTWGGGLAFAMQGGATGAGCLFVCNTDHWELYFRPVSGALPAAVWYTQNVSLGDVLDLYVMYDEVLVVYVNGRLLAARIDARFGQGTWHGIASTNNFNNATVDDYEAVAPLVIAAT